MIANYELDKICSENPILIENYMTAMNDQENVWWLYHRRQMYSKESMKTLKDNNLWYNRPANELIFLKPSKDEIKKWNAKKRRHAEKRRNINTQKYIEEKRSELDHLATRQKNSSSFGIGVADYFNNTRVLRA